jgi:hypothetical protein
VENALHIWVKQYGGVWNDILESVTVKSIIEYTYPVAAQTATPSRSRTPTMTVARTLTPSPTVTPHSAGLQTGLLAWYPLDGIRTTGSTLPIQVDSVFGKAQQFDGVDDYHKTTLDLANKTFSLAFWAQFDIELNQHSTVINTGSVAGDNKAFSCGYSYTLAHVGCGIYGLNMGLHYDAPVGFNLADWHHYAFSFDNSTKQMKLYVDGILVEAHTNPSSVLTSTSEFWIGRPNWGGADWHFKGKVRDVLVYNRVLSSSEIQRIKQITPDRLMQTTPMVAQACRWIDAGGMVHEYEINHDLLTWEQAKAVAESKRRGGQRGYLATITSAVENECIVNFVDQSSGWVSGNTGFGPWLGAKRVSTAGRFMWQVGPEQGMQLKSTLTDAVFGYEHWNSAQPDNNAGLEDAIHIFGRPNLDVYSWNDISSTAQLKSIIEYTYSVTTSPLSYQTPTITSTRITP